MEYLIVYCLGGAIYALLEMLWRGWTHWSMALCGGLCFLIMYIISGSGMGMVKKCLLSAAAISTIEFFTGCLVNLRLHWHIWDYSAARFNLLGQICPAFSALWLLLSAPGLLLCAQLRRLFGQGRM